MGIPQISHLYTYVTAMVMKSYGGSTPFRRHFGIRWTTSDDMQQVRLGPVLRCFQYRRNVKNGVEKRPDHLVHQYSSVWTMQRRLAVA